MANEHPFQSLFQSLGRLPAAHAEPVNRRAYETLYDILSVPLDKPGRCIMLRAPRAGHGKTHLLSRIQHHLGASHEFIQLQAVFGSRIDASSVIDDALRGLMRPLPASGGLCVLDMVARRLFALALQPLVGSGEVPCQDREGALAALRTRPIETFDFHHANAVTAHWAQENFEVLGQRLSVELAQRSGLPARGVAFWVGALFQFASAPVENPVRLRAVADAVHAGDPGDGVLMERLEALLGLLAQLTRVVLVADDLEGFSSDESAALRLAAFLGSLRQSVERLDVVLSLNLDIWESAFLPRLSGGLADRLSEVVVELEPLAEEEMLALLESRVPGLGARVLERVDRSEAGGHARGLIRAAGLAWLRASAQDSRAPAPPPASFAPEPAIAPAAALPIVETVVEPQFALPEPPLPPVESKPAGPPEPPPIVAEVSVEDPVPATWPEPAFPEATEPGESSPAEPEGEIVEDVPAVEAPAVAEVPTEAARKIPEPPPLDPEPVTVPEADEPSEPDAEADLEAGADELCDFGAPPLPEEASAEAGDATEAGPMVPADPDPDTQDGDRVDDLLRQFRERYGRGGS